MSRRPRPSRSSEPRPRRAPSARARDFQVHFANCTSFGPKAVAFLGRATHNPCHLVALCETHV
eukprot:517911-Alexandrium_andersonii.AAC.1